MLQRSAACLVITILSASVVLTGAPALAAEEVPATGGPPPSDSVVQAPVTAPAVAPAVVPAAYELEAEANKYPGAGANVYTLLVTRNGAPVDVDGFDPEVQELVGASLDALSYLGRSPEEPLLVLDPFGTNTTGVYARFATQGEGTLSYTVTAPPSASGYRTSLGRTVEGDPEQLTEGLFAVVGLNRHRDHGLLYDNAGTLRAEFDLAGYGMDRVEFYEDTLLTNVAADRLARIDGLGRVVEAYVLEG